MMYQIIRSDRKSKTVLTGYYSHASSITNAMIARATIEAGNILEAGVEDAVLIQKEQNLLVRLMARGQVLVTFAVEEFTQPGAKS